MYYHETLSVVSNFEVARIIDSERFAGSLAQVEMNTGYRVTNSKLARVQQGGRRRLRNRGADHADRRI